VKKHEKPIFVHTSFARGDIESLNILKTAGVPVIESSDRASQCLGALMKFALNQKKISQMSIPSSEAKERPAVKAIFKIALDENRSNLLETESRALLEEYGISLPEAILAHSPEEAIEAARKMPYPLAMKVVSPDIIHKSDAGGIKLDLKDEKDVGKAFKEILNSAGKVTTKERVLGTLISPMAAEGQECIIGMIRDSQFGNVLSG
jgi:acetyltransferase